MRREDLGERIFELIIKHRPVEDGLLSLNDLLPTIGIDKIEEIKSGLEYLENIMGWIDAVPHAGDIRISPDVFKARGEPKARVHDAMTLTTHAFQVSLTSKGKDEIKRRKVANDEADLAHKKNTAFDRVEARAEASLKISKRALDNSRLAIGVSVVTAAILLWRACNEQKADERTYAPRASGHQIQELPAD